MPRKSRTTVTEPETSETLPMHFESPESSALHGASYDPDTEVLTVVLSHNGGTPYDYDKFPRVMWKEFLEAPSKGTYFQKRIRPVFSGHKRA